MAEAADHTILQMTLVDWLDDLTVRFLLNLPPAELSSVPRLCFQVEEAQWFYEDFIRPANPALPSLNLRQFCLTLFQHCPLLSGFNSAQHLAAYEEFLAYKVRVPVRGAILMDDSMDKVLLVRGWKKGASWSFPRGKINKDEPDIDCAIREVYEETGFDLGAAGLVELNRSGDGQVKAIDVTMREQHMRLFVFRGVALDTHFETRTRKEIGKIQWYNVKDLPGFKKVKGVAGHGRGEAESVKFYMVAPFLGHLKKWIGQQRRKDSAEATQAQHGRNISWSNEGIQATITEDEAEDTEFGIMTNNGGPPGDRSADELKRLLSIGGPAISTSQPQQHVQGSNGAQTNSLLAMLQGSIVAPAGSSLPHTPYEQVDAFIPAREPQTPRRQHNALEATPQSTLPHSPYSPQTMQQGLQQQQSQRHSSMFNPGYSSQLNYPQPGLSHHPSHIQQQLLPQQHRQQSLPAGFLPGQGPQFAQQSNSSGVEQVQRGPAMQNAHLRGSQQQQHLPPHPHSTPDQNRYNNVSHQRAQPGLVPTVAHAPIGSEHIAANRQ
jgi:mRNA-decapping enzyme subunit 2